MKKKGEKTANKKNFLTRENSKKKFSWPKNPLERIFLESATQSQQSCGVLNSVENKKGQVTIFIIIAVMIVILGILIYMFFPKIKTGFGFDSKNPDQFIQTCIKEKIDENINKISVQGGSLNPEHYFLYKNEKIEYLCYTEEYYKTCVMQQPMLKEHIESEIEKGITEEVNNCLDSLTESYEKKGYDVNLKKGKTKVELLPKRISVLFNSSLSLTKTIGLMHMISS